MYKEKALRDKLNVKMLIYTRKKTFEINMIYFNINILE